MNFSHFHTLAFAAACLATPAFAAPCDPKACDPKPCDPRHRSGCAHQSAASVVAAPRASGECVVIRTTNGGCKTVAVSSGVAQAQGGLTLLGTDPEHAPGVNLAGNSAIVHGTVTSTSAVNASVAGTGSYAGAAPDRVRDLLTRVRSAPASPASVDAATIPAPPATPAAPCPPAPALAAEAPEPDVFHFPGVDVQTVGGDDVDYAQALAALADAEALLQSGAGQWEQRGAELEAATEVYARAQAEAAHDGARKRSAEAHARAAQAAERARAAFGRKGASAKALAELEAARAGQRARTSWRGDSPEGDERSLEERIARLEALARARHPGSEQAHGGSRSLEERVAELETLLDATPRPAQERTALGGVLNRLQALPRAPLAPGVYSLDSQSGKLRALAPQADGGTRSLRTKSPAGGAGGGGGARAEAPRGFAQVERANAAKRDAVMSVQRDEVERRMVELRAQMARLREQMNTMREEIEALPRDDERPTRERGAPRAAR